MAKTFIVWLKDSSFSPVAVEAETADDAKAIVQKNLDENTSSLNINTNYDVAGWEITGTADPIEGDDTLDAYGIENKDVHRALEGQPTSSTYCPKCKLIDGGCTAGQCEQDEK